MNKEKLIDHLSKEIETLTNNTLTYRVRAAFTIWIGPFVLLGALIIATKGNIEFQTESGTFWIAVIIAAVSYYGLGVAAAIVEEQAWDQCEDWRRAIVAVSLRDDLKAEELNDLISFGNASKKIRGAYYKLFGLILIAFSAIAVIATHIRKC